MKVEICANSFESAKAAQEGGADRIELCTNLAVGGLTPSYELIHHVLSDLDIATHVLIRPRSGNFVFSENELRSMLKNIAYIKKAGCSGIVSGALTSEGDIDLEATKLLIEASEGLNFTFHRAFDICRRPKEAFQALIALGADCLLSSGQQPKAIDGIELLKELKDLSADRIEIMPGSGIDITNALAFKIYGFKSIHFSAIKKEHAPVSFFETNTVGTSDLATIKEIIKILA